MNTQEVISGRFVIVVCAEEYPNMIILFMLGVFLSSCLVIINLLIN